MVNEWKEGAIVMFSDVGDEPREMRVTRVRRAGPSTTDVTLEAVSDSSELRRACPVDSLPYAVSVTPPDGFDAKPAIRGSHLVTAYQTRFAARGPRAECLRITATWAWGEFTISLVELFLRSRKKWKRVEVASRWSELIKGSKPLRAATPLQARSVGFLANLAADTFERTQTRLDAPRDSGAGSPAEEPKAAPVKPRRRARKTPATDSSTVGR